MIRTIIMVFTILLIYGGTGEKARIIQVLSRTADLEPLGQSNNGSIFGVVTEINSGPIKGVSIVIVRVDVEASTLKTFSTTSDNLGKFKFEGLPGGTYEVTVDTDDSWLMKPIVDRIAVLTSKATKIEIQLQLIDDCKGLALDPASLSDPDKAEIIQWLLSEAVTETMGANYESTSNQRIILSTENLKLNWLSPSLAKKFVLMTPTEIQDKANRDGDHRYWQFEKAKVRGSCVAIALSNLWADGKSSIESGKRTLLGERRLNYIFHKVSGKWVGKFISGWISKL